MALIITFILNSSLAAFVLSRGLRKPLNVIFVAFCLGIAGWALSLFVLFNVQQSLFWGELPFAFAAFILTLFLLFAIAVETSEKDGAERAKRALFLLIAPLIFAILIFKHLVVVSLKIENGVLSPTTGAAYSYFVYFVILCAVASLAVLVYKYKAAKGIFKLRLKYVFLGLALFFIPAIVTNAVLPYFGIRDFNVLGPLFSFFMLTAISYAIVRHHLMDISVIIRRGTVFTILFTVISFLYALFGSFFGDFFPNPWKFLIPSLIVIAGFLPLKNFLETITDKTFFRRHYHLDEILGRINKIIFESNLSLDNLLASFNRLIVDALKLNRGAILILIPKDSFISRQMISDTAENFELTFDNPLIGRLAAPGFRIIDKEDIENGARNPHDAAVHSHDRRLADALGKIGFNLAIPIKYKEQLIGICLLGEKKSGDPFFANDIVLLEHSVNAIAPIIENARMYEELKKTDDAKSRFISIVSHQLRTPLSSARWNLELLQDEETLSPEERKSAFGDVHRSVVATINNLNSLLLVLDIEQGKIFLDLAPGNILQDIKETARTVKNDIGAGNFEINVKAEGDIPEIHYDANKIRFVIYALLHNALTYSPMVKKTDILVSQKVMADSNNLVVAISDYGIGITELAKAEIFKKFFRADEARSLAPSGFGINTYIARSFIAAHGGQMWLESKGIGQGTTFYFRLPIRHN
ncbi:MAG: hypothetical protein HZA37_00120 [Parcubacteria group bacterium]|nr:hypothetical protein [Parcubacteria group bacterium]